MTIYQLWHMFKTLCDNLSILAYVCLKHSVTTWQRNNKNLKYIWPLFTTRKLHSVLRQKDETYPAVWARPACLTMGVVSAFQQTPQPHPKDSSFEALNLEHFLKTKKPKTIKLEYILKSKRKMRKTWHMTIDECSAKIKCTLLCKILHTKKFKWLHYFPAKIIIISFIVNIK